ncbi:uncharacterized protein LOC119501153 [Sebastes umbrosus]|uniref:uncharacterized protein LOC119501153 n=1 Tax=Sebastes umbrosus TaxID=72105 RepID=UPI00189E8158|nr:uncharacterized protein LOC119501153 [Sebastes umbrosus]XP_037647221.1 uncharacterized protein LOC119501153 [Sebastes umbrosus]XP_037647223.1 uncharacterized protein LOC119501153 [Sebastes umbrosus]XP_037647224.1 uncharacterized protein LOC119501153 [Sebastes umbrosus]XP_037647225.1 uncharacterized protein LOC119501153 [Sebastes umbrosus]XP_037647226.1 uncharacterized protein LOC119501153 [Sebastes umbrosus]XP_037647227.1 uncharacterized protein LOC119501153 [Sebastes umbrosus]
MQDNMKKKKKQRARKLTKKQHKNVSMDETVQPFRSNRPEFEGFLSEMTRWFSDHQLQVDELFSHSDADRNGSVNLKDFYLGLMNLNVPCQPFQLHMLTQQLKTANDMISYRDLSRQVQRLRLSDSTEIDTQISRCDQHQLLNPEQDRRFIRLSVRLIPFDSAAAHPGNFEVVLLSSSRVFSLIRMIKDRVGIQTSRLEVYRSRVPTEEARLPPEGLLEDVGFRGGPEGSPPEDTVYYDYRLMFTDCPVLNCDHYFRSMLDAAATRSGHCL